MNSDLIKALRASGATSPFGLAASPLIASPVRDLWSHARRPARRGASRRSQAKAGLAAVTLALVLAGAWLTIPPSQPLADAAPAFSNDGSDGYEALPLLPRG